ncbi:MAG TPA: hypothetical protein PKC97_18760 [Burkholderiaceae bacterium]|nr:hypothetical protein [Burkholderiaceae bacterium]
MRGVGAKVHRHKSPKPRGQMPLADASRAVIGSVDLAQGGADKRK